jgi:thiol-disulfide isomerase/thioredoxin
LARPFVCRKLNTIRAARAAIISSNPEDAPMRLLCAAALSLSFGLWFAFSEDKKPGDSPAARAAKLADRKKKFDEEYKELADKLRKATSQEEARAAQSEMRELTLLTAEKVLTIAEGDPKDEVGFDAAAFILQMAGKTGTSGPEIEKAVAIVAEHHVNNPKVKEFLIPAIQMGAAGEKLLKAVSEKSTDKNTQGLALFLRGYMIAQKIDDEEDDKKVPLLAKQATDLIEQAVKLAPDAKLGVSPNAPTIKTQAASELESLKAIANLAVGKPAPEVASKLLDGKDVKLSDYKGKVVLLDMWATWCPPCRAMIPHERDMVKKLKDKPFVLVSVSADKEKETLEKFLEKEPMPWVHWWDNGPNSKVLKSYRVQAFPTLYLIDHSGVIRHKWVGAPGNAELDKAIDELVAAAIKAKG